MASPITPELETLAAFQHGIVRRGQAISAGLSPSAIKRRVGSGEWRRVGPGVYATFTGKSTREAKLWITLLQAGDGAMYSHETAAELHGFVGKPSRVLHITVPAGHRVRAIPGVAVHRSRIAIAEPHASFKLPRTTPEDTVLDLIDAATTFDEAYNWICRAVGRGVTVPVLLRESLRRRSRIRWREWLTEALAEKSEGLDSPLERRYARDVERAHGLPAAHRQAHRGDRYLDNLYEEYRLCVELDGDAAHPPESKWKDAERDNDNIAGGDIRTMRFGWVAVTEKRCRTAQRVANALRYAGWAGAPRPCGPGCPVA